MVRFNTYLLLAVVAKPFQTGLLKSFLFFSRFELVNVCEDHHDHHPLLGQRLGKLAEM